VGGAAARVRVSDDDGEALLGRAPGDAQADDAAADDDDIGLRLRACT
jgi:hypothetical protein